MRIGIINLPIDNNYGGHLQRYALIKVLESMGCDVKHICQFAKSSLPWYKKPYSYPKRFLLKYILHKDILIFLEEANNKKCEKQLTNFIPFYENYIPHTSTVETFSDIANIIRKGNFDVLVVGSDQVWRKSMVGGYSHLKKYMLDFRGYHKRKVAYGISMGTDTEELGEKEIQKLCYLYREFKSVSVRETSALSLFEQRGWVNPKAEWVLDPTLLLQKEDYNKLIEQGKTMPQTGDLFCYILDSNSYTDSVIKAYSSKLGYKTYYAEIKSDASISVEQWLRNIRDAKFVITDSYHGFLFSIIYQKPFKLLLNKKRGNSRFDTIIEKLDLHIESDLQDWDSVSDKLKEYQKSSIDFIKKSLRQ